MAFGPLVLVSEQKTKARARSEDEVFVTALVRDFPDLVAHVGLLVFNGVPAEDAAEVAMGAWTHQLEGRKTA
jgi:hypothetical protein